MNRVYSVIEYTPEPEYLNRVYSVVEYSLEPEYLNMVIWLELFTRWSQNIWIRTVSTIILFNSLVVNSSDLFYWRQLWLSSFFMKVWSDHVYQPITIQIYRTMFFTKCKGNACLNESGQIFISFIPMTTVHLLPGCKQPPASGLF